MLQLVSDITIGDVNFDFVTDLEIESAWDELTDTAKITLPFRITKDGEAITIADNSIFRRNMPVTIKLGYLPNLQTIFVGYVSRVLPYSPMVIECQDAAWLLKKDAITKEYKQKSITEIAQEIAPQVEFDIENENVTTSKIDLRLTKVTAAQALETIKRNFGLVSYFRKGRLKIGLAYTPTNTEEHVFGMERNIISHNLDYQFVEDIKIKIEYISMLPSNKKITATAGDAEGQTFTTHVYNVTDVKLLQTMADNKDSILRYEGYRGSFTTFGTPVVEHGDLVSLTDPKFPEREQGQYRVDKVYTSFGQNGYRQEITLGPRN